MNSPSATDGETSVQKVIATMAANRCYACGWPLGSCQPFNCAMRFKDENANIAEREKWHARATEMNEVLGTLLKAPVSETAMPNRELRVVMGLLGDALNCGLEGTAFQVVADAHAKVEALVHATPSATLLPEEARVLLIEAQSELKIIASYENDPATNVGLRATAQAYRRVIGKISDFLNKQPRYVHSSEAKNG